MGIKLETLDVFIQASINETRNREQISESRRHKNFVNIVATTAHTSFTNFYTRLISAYKMDSSNVSTSTVKEQVTIKGRTVKHDCALVVLPARHFIVLEEDGYKSENNYLRDILFSLQTIYR